MSVIEANASKDVEVSFQRNNGAIRIEPSTTSMESNQEDVEEGAASTRNNKPSTEPKVDEVENEHDDDDDEKEHGQEATTSKRNRLAVAVGCGSCILMVGIVALVLGLQGYFSFHEPCVGMKSFSLGDLDLSSILGDEAGSNNQSEAMLIFQIIQMLSSGKNASELNLPPTLNVTLNMTMEINNTNPYSMTYKQAKVGTITLPASNMASNSTSPQGNNGLDEVLTIAPEHKDDWIIGTWGIPESTLKKRARNEIPITVRGSIDLANRGDDGFGLVDMFLSGGALVVRVNGDLEGSSWVPGLAGGTHVVCVAQVNIGQEAKVKCRKSITMGSLINQQEELDFGGTVDMLAIEEEDDPSCYV